MAAQCNKPPCYHRGPLAQGLRVTPDPLHRWTSTGCVATFAALANRLGADGQRRRRRAACPRSRSASEYLRRWPVQLGASYAPPRKPASARPRRARRLPDCLPPAGGARAQAGEPRDRPSTTSLLSRLARSRAALLRPATRSSSRTPITRPTSARGCACRRTACAYAGGVSGRTACSSSSRISMRCCRSARGWCVSRMPPTCWAAPSTSHRSWSRGRAGGARTCVDGVAFAPHRALACSDWGVDWYAFSLYKVFGPHCALLASSPAAAALLTNLNHEWMSPTGAACLEPGAWPYELAWGAPRCRPTWRRSARGMAARLSTRSPRHEQAWPGACSSGSRRGRASGSSAPGRSARGACRPCPSSAPGARPAEVVASTPIAPG
jgi:hypothetical protein